MLDSVQELHTSEIGDPSLDYSDVEGDDALQNCDSEESLLEKPYKLWSFKKTWMLWTTQRKI